MYTMRLTCLNYIANIDRFNSMSKLSVLERVDLQIPVMVFFTYIFLPFFVSKNVKLLVNNKFANSKCEVKQNK